MGEASLFADESGSDGFADRHYLLTPVLHDQSDDIGESIAKALHGAMDYALSRNAAAYKVASPAEYRLSQVADYVCTVELAALKYRDGCPTATDRKFFGSWSDFKRGVLKEVRRKLL